MAVSKSPRVECCAHCYAETFTDRLGTQKIWGPPATTARKTFGERHWNEPRRWNRDAKAAGVRRRVFSSSMGDNFENHPTVIAELQKLWRLITDTPSLDWQLLTKRHDRIAASLPANWDAIKSHVWLGVSIENNDYVHRADALRGLDPAVRFVSYEPALGPLDRLDLTGINWVIYGGESGPNFRGHDVQWARDMRDRCKAAGCAFFYKQSPAPRTEMGIRLDGRIVRDYPTPRYLPMVQPEEFDLS